MLVRSLLLLLLSSLFWATPANADVDVTFYSHDFGDSFPHAFFTVKGSIKNPEAAIIKDSDEANIANDIMIDNSYGFTAIKISPAILWKSVTGAVQTPEDKYIDDSNPHFTVTINDEQYAALMTIVKKWEDREQKSYSLKKRNCVHFASEAIAILGYKFNEDTKFWRKPKSFLLEVLDLNPTLVAIDYKKVKADIKAANRTEKEKEKKASKNDKGSTNNDKSATNEDAI